MIEGSVLLILMTVYYEFVCKKWVYLQIGFIIISFIGLILFLIYVPESPKYYYGKSQFNESR